MGKKLTAIDAFSGPGGLSLGLSNAGFKVALGFDIDEMSVATYNKNHNHPGYQMDASKVKGEKLLDLAGLDELDLFAGGPPCQGFSKQKRGAHLGDDRNKLVLDYSRLVREIRPKCFLLENVAMLGQKRGVDFIMKLHSQLKEYKTYPHFYNAADYGLAQTRQRFIVVGVRVDIDQEFCSPEPTVEKWRTIRDVIGDLPEPPKDYTHHPDYPNHQRARVTDINIKRFSYVPQGGGWQDIPEEMRIKAHQNVDTSKGGWPDVYGRLEWNGQCPTITGGFDSFTRGRYGHPKYDRPLTPREAARLQGFPDDYIFEGSRGHVRSQIGNAVPPPLAEAIGIQILNLIKKSKRSANQRRSQTRGREVTV